MAARWLDDDEQGLWRSFLRGFNLVTRYLDGDLRKFGLDLNEYEILAHLSEASEHRMRMSELAEKVLQSRSRLTHSISRLEKRGLVERGSCQTDGRGVVAHLTAGGMDLLVELAPTHVAGVRRIFFDNNSKDDLDAVRRCMENVADLAE